MDFWIRETLRWNGDADAVPFTSHNYPADPIEKAADRRAAIIAMRLSGKSLKETGEAFGITRQRVEQICRGVPQQPNLSKSARVDWTCPICGSVLQLLSGEVKVRQQVGECSPCVSLRSARRGKAIVERRLAGETWMDIQHSITQDLYNKSSNANIAADARAWLKYSNASAETWGTVFPGCSRPHTARARNRMSISQTLRWALRPQPDAPVAKRESPSGDTQSSSPSSDRMAAPASQPNPAASPSPATTR